MAGNLRFWQESGNRKTGVKGTLNSLKPVKSVLSRHLNLYGPAGARRDPMKIVGQAPRLPLRTRRQPERLPYKARKDSGSPAALTAGLPVCRNEAILNWILQWQSRPISTCTRR